MCKDNLAMIIKTTFKNYKKSKYKSKSCKNIKSKTD